MPHTRLIHVLDHLQFLGEVSEKRMFGGYGLYLDGQFFGLIDRQGEFYLRANETTRADFEQVGGHPFQPNPDQKPMNYWSVPDSLLCNSKKLLPLARHALSMATQAKKSKRSKDRKPR
jgi:DNA transformation protein and related proteins